MTIQVYHIKFLGFSPLLPILTITSTKEDSAEWNSPAWNQITWYTHMTHITVTCLVIHRRNNGFTTKNPKLWLTWCYRKPYQQVPRTHSHLCVIHHFCYHSSGDTPFVLSRSGQHLRIAMLDEIFFVNHRMWHTVRHKLQENTTERNWVSQEAYSALKLLYLSFISLLKVLCTLATRSM